MKKILIAIVVVLLLLHTSVVLAQDLFSGSDLSTVQVDNLSNADIVKLKNQLQANNISVAQAEQLALAKGMSATEFGKLRIRLETVSDTPSSDNSSSLNGAVDSKELTRKQEKISNIKVKDTVNALIFGSELFDTPTLNFEPNLKLATPLNYVLGPGDELQVSVYGVQEFNAAVPVTMEGKVNIQYVG